VQVLRKFIAVFLVLTLFFNMNTVALGNGLIIDSLEGTNPTTNLEFITPDSANKDFQGDPDPTHAESSGLVKTILDLISKIGEGLLTPVIALIQILPSPELFIFGGESVNGTFQANSPTQLTFFTSEAKGLAGGIQGTTASIYNALRYLVTAFYIIILVYLAIRILLSSVGKQKAHYKSLLQYWILGLLLLFSFHWVMAFIIWLSDTLTGIFADIGLSQLEGSTLWGGKETITYTIAVSLAGITSSAGAASALLNYFSTFGVWGILIGNIYALFIAIGCLFATLVIGFVYLKRLLFIALLIIVFPLVVLAYVFDKIGDKKSQTLNFWIKEFTVNVFIQPIHALLLAFIIVLLKTSIDGVGLFDIPIIGPILALALLFLIPSGEKFLKQLFQISSSMGVGGGISNTISSLAHQGLAMAHLGKMAKPLMGIANKTTGMDKIFKKYDVDPKSTPRKLSDAFLPGGRKQRALDSLKQNNDPRYKAIMDDVKALTGKDSYKDARRANRLEMASAFTGLAAGSGLAAMGQTNLATMAAGFGGTLGTKIADKTIGKPGHQYKELAKKIQKEGINNLSDDDLDIIKDIYGDTKNIPHQEKLLKDLEFKQQTMKYGGIKDAKVATAVLPSQRANRERVFGENGILNTNERNNYTIEIDKKNMTLKKKDGSEKITILGEGDSTLKHPISVPASGISSAKQKSEILEKTLDKITNDAGITTANGYTPEKIEKFKERKRSEVLDEIDTVSSKVDTLSNRPPIMKTVAPNKTVNLSLNSAQKIDSFEKLDEARMHPEENLLTADDINQISSRTLDKVSREADRDVHRPYLINIKTNPAIQPQFDSILASHNIDSTTYQAIDPNQTADFAGAMQEFHALDNSIPTDCYSASGVQRVQNIRELSEQPHSNFGITDATYNSITQQAVIEAQTIQNTRYAQQIVTDVVQNTPSYAISTSERDEILRTNNIDPTTFAPINNAVPQNFTAAAEGLRDLQEFRKPHSGTVIQAANDIIHGTVRYERSTATLSEAQLTALQNAGALQMTYSGSDVTITPVMNPDAAITVPSGLNLPTGETIIKSGIVDPLNATQILQTYADVDRFTLEQTSSTPTSGTVCDMDAIDLTKLPTSQFTMIRSGDYCVIVDSSPSQNIIYSQRGLTVIPDTYNVKLTPHVTGGGNTEYLIDSNSPINSDMVIELKRKADLLKARSIGVSDAETKEQARLAQVLMNDLAAKLGLNLSK